MTFLEMLISKHALICTPNFNVSRYQALSLKKSGPNRVRGKFPSWAYFSNSTPEKFSYHCLELGAWLFSNSNNEGGIRYAYTLIVAGASQLMLKIRKLLQRIYHWHLANIFKRYAMEFKPHKLTKSKWQKCT